MTTKEETSNHINKSINESIKNLINSFKKYKFNQQIIYNLSCYYNDDLIIWNNDEQCLYCYQMDDCYNLISVQILTLSSLPTFDIDSIKLNPLNENYLVIYGQNGLMIVELPKNWSTNTLNSSINPTSVATKKSPLKSLIRSFSLSERMFLTNNSLKLLCLRWHPISKRHLIILTNDNHLRLYDIFNEYEPITIINLCNDHDSGLYSEAFGESAVSFDFGPSLSQYYYDSIEQSKLDELTKIHLIFVLKENGDVLLLYLNLNDVSSFSVENNVRPLKMLPAAEDNYGSEACSILCLDCVPPIIIIGTCSGSLYHCLAIENDDNDLDENTYQISIKNSIIKVPEIVLNVFEMIELTFPLATYQNGDRNQNDNNLLNNDTTKLTLVSDPKDGQRYFCHHSYGVHCIMVPFFRQLFRTSSKTNDEFFDDQAIVEYLVCTKPTIDNPVNDNDDGNDPKSKTRKKEQTFPIGLALTIRMGFTTMTIILNTGEFINKQLSNIVLNDDYDSLIDAGKLLSSFDFNDSLTFIELNQQQQQQQPPMKKSNFSDYIQKLLTKQTTLPLIKSSMNRNSTKIGLPELEMLLNSIEILRNEYLDKYQLASNAIDKRKTVLNIEIDVQMNQLQQLNTDKDSLLHNYVQLIEKYEQTQASIKHLYERLEMTIMQIQRQQNKMSDCELKLLKQLKIDEKLLDDYREQFKSIKQKKRYQEMQIKKHTLQQQQQSINNNDDLIDGSISSTNNNIHQQQSPLQVKNIHQILANQSKEITELISIINNLKKKQ